MQLDEDVEVIKAPIVGPHSARVTVVRLLTAFALWNLYTTGRFCNKFKEHWLLLTS